MIAAALVESGIRRDSFGFVPFPIETPQRLSEFMPTTVPCFTTICEQWNHEKIQLLRRYGYQVHVLWEKEQKTVSSSIIRDNIAAGGNEWRSMVPPAVAHRLEGLNTRARLVELRQLSEGSQYTG
jgi:hypothetical protein